MARTRIIKPEFFFHDELASLKPIIRLLFIGLWTIADKAGRLKDRPNTIKAQILPFDNFDANEGLQELDRHHFITRYVVDNSEFIQINAWHHQSPHHTEKESSLPELNPLTVRQPLDNGSLTSLTYKEESIVNSNDLKKSFENFWLLYPSRNGTKGSRKKAEEQWIKFKEKEHISILEALYIQINHFELCKKNGKFMAEFPDAFRWLRDKRFLDEIIPEKTWQEKFREEMKVKNENTGI